MKMETKQVIFAFFLFSAEKLAFGISGRFPGSELGQSKSACHFCLPRARMGRVACCEAAIAPYSGGTAPALYRTSLYALADT
jgi:hypothetical protein